MAVTTTALIQALEHQELDQVIRLLNSNVGMMAIVDCIRAISGRDGGSTDVSPELLLGECYPTVRAAIPGYMAKLLDVLRLCYRYQDNALTDQEFVEQLVNLELIKELAAAHPTGDKTDFQNEDHMIVYYEVYHILEANYFTLEQWQFLHQHLGPIFTNRALDRAVAYMDRPMYEWVASQIHGCTFKLDRLGGSLHSHPSERRWEIAAANLDFFIAEYNKSPHEELGTVASYFEFGLAGAMHELIRAYFTEAKPEHNAVLTYKDGSKSPHFLTIKDFRYDYLNGMRALFCQLGLVLIHLRTPDYCRKEIYGKIPQWVTINGKGYGHDFQTGSERDGFLYAAELYKQLTSTTSTS